jgi:hypothetical protein
MVNLNLEKYCNDRFCMYFSFHANFKIE